MPLTGAERKKRLRDNRRDKGLVDLRVYVRINRIPAHKEIIRAFEAMGNDEFAWAVANLPRVVREQFNKET